MVATAGLLLVQVPPVVGDTPDMVPIQILLNPVILTVGNALTVTPPVGAETHPVMEWVNIKVAAPADTPVTKPALVTVATEGSLLTQVPPVVGDKVVERPTQILLEPVILTTGKAFTVTAPVGNEVQPVAVRVKENVAVPADTPVTTPALSTVATAGLLLAHVPPEAGDKVVVPPAQIVLTPAIFTKGNANTVTVPVVDEQFGELLLVKVKVAVPAATPVTTPALVTVATAGSLLTQVPPEDGDKVVVTDTQIVLAPTILTTGRLVTETAAVGNDTQPVLLFVKENVTVPVDTPVTIPAFVTVATPGLLLAQVPPETGDKVVVNPAQILFAPVMLTTGKGSTVTGGVAGEAQPVAVLVKTNVAEPADTPVTTPALVTVATEGLLLIQVPPEDGDKVVVEPAQIVFGPAILTGVREFTVTVAVVALQLGEMVLVKVNVTVPPETAVTKPAFVTVATVGLLLTQVPPVVGDKVVVAPTQIVLAPVILTTGKAFTVTAEVAAETQPVAVLVNVNVAVPTAIAVTTPSLATVATPGSLLTQVPPVVGDSVVVLFTQILLAPVILTTGKAFTVTAAVATEIQPLDELVKVNEAAPPDTPVTTPAFVTEAIVALLLDHVPPEVGETPVNSPTQIVLTPERFTDGARTMVMVEVAEAVQPSAFDTVTV